MAVYVFESVSLAADGDVSCPAVHITARPGFAFYPIASFIPNRLGESHSPSRSVPCLTGEALTRNPDIEMRAQTQSADETAALDKVTIIDRGRGPEIAGTRITVYTIMDFLKYNYSISDIAGELMLTADQVQAAVDYIRSHQAESDREYGLIMERMNQPNPPEVERGRAKTREELRQRIRARLERKRAHDHSVGQ
jgi:uncharacterized protein (DUF433 family)